VTARGKSLELAIARAARGYRKEARACLMRQFPQMAWRGGSYEYVSDAPIDFIGVVYDREQPRAYALECKETGEASFPIAKLEEHQRQALEAFRACGADTRIAVDFTRIKEVYLLDWLLVDTFILAPWRKSLTVDWCRAYGLLIPEENRDKDETRRALFLEGAAHKDQARCLEIVSTERQQKPVISLDSDFSDEDDDDEREVRKELLAPMTPEQIRRRGVDAINASLDRASKQLAKQSARERNRKRWSRAG